VTFYSTELLQFHSRKNPLKIYYIFYHLNYLETLTGWNFLIGRWKCWKQLDWTSEEEQKFSFKESDFDIWDQDPKQLILDDSSMSDYTEDGSVPGSPESNQMEEYFTVLGFCDNSEVIRDRCPGAVLVLEKPSSVADHSDVEDHSNSGVNLRGSQLYL
jgi:hypothetical protein